MRMLFRLNIQLAAIVPFSRTYRAMLQNMSYSGVIKSRFVMGLVGHIEHDFKICPTLT